MRYAAAAVYIAAFLGLGAGSARLLSTRGVCADVGAFGILQARSSLGGSLPVPVVAMCSHIALPLLLILCVIAASFAWWMLLRSGAPRAVLAICGVIAAAMSLFFPYVSTTDPYAYATYGYEAAHGISPYRQPPDLPRDTGAPLKTLYAFFPRGSWNRVANYGPVAVAQYDLLARIAGNSLQRFVVLSRVFNLGLLVLLALALRRVGGNAFVAFHPLLLIESVAFAHGDVLFLVLLAFAYVAYRRGSLVLCASLIVLATEVRAVAGLAFVVLVLALLQEERTRDLLRPVTAASIIAAISVAVSFLAYGGFTLGGSPAVAPYSAPLALALNLHGVSHTGIVLGGALQAIAGLVLLLIALRSRQFFSVPFCALATLPIAQSWYCQWVIPQIAFERRTAYAAAAVALSGTAILAEWPQMTGRSDLATWAVILAVQWLLPLCCVLALSAKGSGLTLFGAPAAEPVPTPPTPSQ
jgi:hypothetical protein